MIGKTNMAGARLFAVIAVTYPEGSTCGITTDPSGFSDVIYAKDTSGYWLFTVPYAGNWYVASYTGDISNPDKITYKVVGITTEGQSESVTLSYELVAFLNGVTDPAVGGWTGGTITSNVLRFNPGGGYSGRVCSNNELDLRGFTKITFHVKKLDSQDNSSSKVGISSTNANNSSFITSATMPTGGGAWSTSDVTKVIDITSVDSGYIKIYGSSSNSTAMLKLDIDKILLE